MVAVLFTALIMVVSLDRHSPPALFFTDLRLALQSTPPDPSLYIRSIIVNTNPNGRVICSSNLVPYEFFVLLTNGKSFSAGACALNTTEDGYLREINTYLTNSRGYPEFRSSELKNIPLTVGDGERALDAIINRQ